MAAQGLTSQDAAASSSANDVSRFSDSEGEDRAATLIKSPSDIFSGVYRGFKKFGRDDAGPAKLTKQPSHLTLKHSRSQSLQSSLEKPLPEPPAPQLSPASPVTPLTTPRPINLESVLSADGQPGPNPPSTSPGTRASAVAIAAPDPTTSPEPSSGTTGTLRSALQPSAIEPPPPDGSVASSAMSGMPQQDGDDAKDNLTPRSNGLASIQNTASPPPVRIPTTEAKTPANSGAATPQSANPIGSSAHLSGLMCNVHRTTGREPHPLVGATTTILGDKLYVFGGRILTRSRPAPLTSDLYELDLIRRHWTKLETTGDIPPPRYFHSMCALGDTKMVCYGGMSPSSTSPSGGDGAGGQQDQQQAEVTVVSDIHIFDVPTRKWTFIPAPKPPQGRYAHCACILPSSATFASQKAPMSALQHNPSTGVNEGRIGINIDGSGGAEMIVVGGQDSRNNYIEQISVFNLRSLKWTSHKGLGKSCGAYRSVVAPLPPSVTAKIGKANAAAAAAATGVAQAPQQREGGISQESREPGSSMLVYSNYNFLDVKLELQIRSPDGSLVEKPMTGAYSPPGLRFPNGGVIDTFFVVSGTYLTSSKQEYALWALDLKTLTWSRIDAGGAVFSQGSWNRGILWNRRNTFVVLGSRKRSLVDDYNHRRINFSNVCMVELEAFGLYDNPRRTSPMSGFISASSPYTSPGLSLGRKAGWKAGGRQHSRAAEELGEKALSLRELADMDILCLGGDRIPVNSRLVARRWGPYFVHILREATAVQDGSDAATLRTTTTGAPSTANSRVSGITITPVTSRGTVDSVQSTATAGSGTSKATTLVGGGGGPNAATVDPTTLNNAPTPLTLAPGARPRCLYLPHTFLTVQALLHFLYTSALPPHGSPLCSPQILCSLLQIARPYRVDGLLEAVVERLHTVFDPRNAAAVFNATAMAAGGGRGIDGILNPNFFVPIAGTSPTSASGPSGAPAGDNGAAGAPDMQPLNTESGAATAPPRLNTQVGSGRPSSADMSSAASASGSEWESELGDSERGAGPRQVWTGELSSVIGLQKRGLRGLMEGRRMRERTGTGSGNAPGGGAGQGGSGQSGGMGGSQKAFASVEGGVAGPSGIAGPSRGIGVSG